MPNSPTTYSSECDRPPAQVRTNRVDVALVNDLVMATHILVAQGAVDTIALVIPAPDEILCVGLDDETHRLESGRSMAAGHRLAEREAA